MSGDLKIVSRDFLRKYQKLGRKYFLKSFFSIIHTLTDRCKKNLLGVKKTYKKSQFLEGNCWKSGSDFFQGGVAVFT